MFCFRVGTGFIQTLYNMAKWPARDEMKLFQAMRHSKPIGVHKHFAIISIVEELKSTLARHVTVAEVWAYIEALYDVAALDDFETLPFPNDVLEFCLPESEFPETVSDVGSESDQKHSVADSLDLDTSADVSLRLNKSRTSEKSTLDDNTPRRAPKRTRASTQQAETPATTKRRRT